MDDTTDLWHSRDLPVLQAIAEAVDRDPFGYLGSGQIAATLDISHDDVVRAIRALEHEYLERVTVDLDGRADVGGITPEARRAVGMWTNPDTAADRLLKALEEAGETASTEEQRTALQKARTALASAGRDVLVGVATAVITGTLPR